MRREQNFKKKPHTASFLMAFHTAVPESARMAQREEIAAETYVAPVNTPTNPNVRSTRLAQKITTQSVRMATSGQKAFIRSLNDQIIDDNCKISESDISTIEFAEVNEVLALLKSIIAAEKSAPKKSNDITEGAYWYGDLIARVQKTKDGKRYYAKLQTEVGGKSFEYAPGLMGKLKKEDMLSIADMQVFAKAHSACADCGKSMTNPMSIARGVGPICSGKGYTEI